MTAAVLDPVRTAARAIRPDLTKDRCAEGKAALALPTAQDREQLGIVDIVVIHGDHVALQVPGVTEYVPTADCIVFIARTVGKSQEIVMVLVELKDGDWSVGNVRDKFANSWGHGAKLLSDAKLTHRKAALRMLGGHAKKPEDRNRFRAPIRSCQGQVPKAVDAKAQLADILRELD